MLSGLLTYMPSPWKMAVGLFFIVMIFLFFSLGAHEYLTLEHLQQSKQRFRELYQSHTFAVISGFFLLYIIIVTVNLPGAAIMTLAAGTLFGFWIGLVLVSFASSIGCTLSCMVARYLFRDWTRKKLGSWYARINEGIKKEGAFYLFTLRIVSVIPLLVVNLGMALTSMRLITFHWVSQLGMLPGSAVLVNAGRQLGEINEISDILSPGLIISFAILAVFPLAAKKIVNFVRVRTGREQVTIQEEMRKR